MDGREAAGVLNWYLPNRLKAVLGRLPACGAWEQEGFGQPMLKYEAHLKEKARKLRSSMTDSEKVLWSRVRRKQILGVQFYRQKPIGNHIVDFYATQCGLVVEVDGSQHLDAAHARKDAERDAYMMGIGLTVLRFSSRDVLRQTDAVVPTILQAVRDNLKGLNPPRSPFQEGGSSGAPIASV